MVVPRLPAECRADRLAGALRAGILHQGVRRRLSGFTTAEYSLVWVVQGRGVLLRTGMEDVPLTPGTVFQRLPRLVYGHAFRDEPPPCICYLALPAGAWALLQACALPGLAAPAMRLRDGAGLLPAWEALCHRLRDAPPGRDAELVAAAFAFAIALHRRCDAAALPGADQRWLTRACTALNRHACDGTSLRAVLAPLGGSYTWARHRFRALAGCSPDAWRRARRMETARSLLLGSDLDLTQVAERLGYADAFAFSRQFARAQGMPPGRFRQIGGGQE
jgi:AraC-like DNA-binding protein